MSDQTALLSWGWTWQRNSFPTPIKQMEFDVGNFSRFPSLDFNCRCSCSRDREEKKRKTLWSRMTKNPGISTGPLVRLFARSAYSFARLLTLELVGKWMIYAGILDHCGEEEENSREKTMEFFRWTIDDDEDCWDCERERVRGSSNGEYIHNTQLY